VAYQPKHVRDDPYEIAEPCIARPENPQQQHEEDPCERKPRENSDEDCRVHWSSLDGIGRFAWLSNCSRTLAGALWLFDWGFGGRVRAPRLLHGLRP